MLNQRCGADHHGDGERCVRQVNHLQDCPDCGLITYLQIHSCPGRADDDTRAAEMYE